MATKGTFTIHIGNIKEELPRYRDCPMCGAEESCAWEGVAYAPVCPSCYQSEDYQAKDKAYGRVRQQENKIKDALEGKYAAAVWQYKDQMITTNHKGNIIGQESVKNHKAKYERR